MRLTALLLLCSFSLFGQMEDSTMAYIKEHYYKKEYRIPMRDGIKLFTAVYLPKDSSKTYPILLKRTCYGVKPYGEENFPQRGLDPSEILMRKGYIFVYQDVRGRWMSEGEFDNMRPNIPGNKPKNTQDIDESSDTYDTIDWLLQKLSYDNGKVGQWGISYPGFYTAAALPDAHPALKASSPQAPIGDFFFDDFHHQGAFTLSYFLTFPVFGYQTDGPTQESWYNHIWERVGPLGNTNDAYEYLLKLGPLSTITEKVYPDNFFWKQIVEHPNYDEFWQKRSIIPHLKKVKHAVMTVGGWLDAEDLYGPLNIYKSLERNSPRAQNSLVMGPWSHGDWARDKPQQMVNHIYFGDDISAFYQKEIEAPFFEYHLRGAASEAAKALPEAYLFDTGAKEWKRFEAWPSPDLPQVRLGLGAEGQLLINEKGDAKQTFSYTSDPAHPVPYRSEIRPLPFTPRAYMTDDQRHASYRPDVLTFESEVLEEDLTLGGELLAKLRVAISTTDADFVVKIIDVHPNDAQSEVDLPEHVQMGGYQQLVRAETFRGRFRESFEKPQPFEPNTPTELEFELQDLLHTFKKGHKVMLQIHSTWFPYIDRNPQRYVENIYKAEASDFIKSEITVYGDSEIQIGLLQP